MVANISSGGVSTLRTYTNSDATIMKTYIVTWEDGLFQVWEDEIRKGNTTAHIGTPTGLNSMKLHRPDSSSAKMEAKIEFIKTYKSRTLAEIDYPYLIE